MGVLVTGGAGYIGSVVAAQLLAAGHAVVVLDDLSRGHAEVVPPGAEHVAVSLLDPGALGAPLSAGIDAVVHFAALSLVAESVERPERYWHNNVVGTRHLLDATRAAGVGRLVFSSTAATYGDPERIPITEDDPAAPVNAYGASKLAVDLMLRDECVAHGLGAASLRYFNVAGASRGLGEDHEPETHLIPLVLQAAAGVRDHITVFGTDYETRDGPAVREVIEAARRVTGREIPVREAGRRPGDPPQLVAANARAHAELGWTPRRGLDEMSADAWAWHRAHPRGYAG